MDASFCEKGRVGTMWEYQTVTERQRGEAGTAAMSLPHTHKKSVLAFIFS